MEKEKIEILKDSFAGIYAQKASLERRFYKHLFEANPETQALFRNGQYVRKEMMATILAVTVQLLNRPKSFRKMGRRLAQQHQQAGVSFEQYTYGPDAMIKAFHDILGDRFTPEIEAVWREAMQEMVSCFATPD